MIYKLCDTLDRMVKRTLVQHLQPSRHIDDSVFSARSAEDDRFSSTTATPCFVNLNG